MQDDEFDLTDRAQLKKVRTAFNEYCNYTPDSPEYFAIYTNQSEQQILEGLKKAVGKQIEDSGVWLSKAPDEILLFAGAAGLIPSDVRALDDTEAVEEDDDEDSDVEDEDEDEDEEDEDSDDTDDDSDIDDEDEAVEEHPKIVSEADEDDDNAEVAYVIDLPSEEAAGTLTKLMLEISKALTQTDVDVIEVWKHGRRKEEEKPQPVKKDKTKNDDISLEGLEKRLRVGGDLLNRANRIAFIKQHNIPVKGDINKIPPKELATAIKEWAKKNR